MNCLSIGEIMDDKNKESPDHFEKVNEKIETCYICHKEFNINENNDSHYHYNEYPMCSYCSEFYGFYKKNR